LVSLFLHDKKIIPPVLCPGLFIWPLIEGFSFSKADGGDAVFRYPEKGQVIPGGLSPSIAERQIVFNSASFITLSSIRIVIPG
jgi:hypothetical protein